MAETISGRHGRLRSLHVETFMEKWIFFPYSRDQSLLILPNQRVISLGFYSKF